MGPDARTDRQSRLLTDSANRAVVSALEDAGGALHVEELGARLVDQDVALVATAEYEDRLEATLASLHHHRLPKLDDAGVVEYDPAENVVEPASPAAAVDWQDGPAPELLVDRLSAGERDGDGIGVLEGRGSVIRYGRRLADRAEEELFCMYVSTALLEAACVDRARSAIDRGVSVYLGSGNPEVRDLARERLPEATVWEPQLDWLNTPSYPRVGRLVVADRGRAMLAVLEAPTDEDDHPQETAIVGEGSDNPVVTLVRELLGPRLDHLDYQSDDFASELRP